jgi:SAM-dependent methyltransferase
MSIGDRSMDAIYDDLWNAGEVERWATVQEEMQPRTPSRLFDLVADIGLNPAACVLDVGCGQGDHTCELASRFGVQVMAMDMVESSLESTRQRVAAKNLATQVCVQKGVIEQLPFADSEFDLVWCRSVIVHLPQVLPAFQECRRVLKLGGHMMLQTGYATDLLEPQEAALLRQRLGFYAASMSRPTVEAAIQASGFKVVGSEVHGSEFAEYYEQREGRCAHHLMGIARLQRAEVAIVARFGRALYETALGMYYWQVYQMLGKISYHAYLLQK